MSKVRDVLRLDNGDGRVRLTDGRDRRMSRRYRRNIGLGSKE